MKTVGRLTLNSLVVAIGLMVPSASHAALFTYDYLGNFFEEFEPPYSGTDRVSGWFTVDLLTNENLPELTDISGDLVSFSFSDGVQTISDADNVSIFEFEIATDGDGDITRWSIALLNDDTLSGITTANRQDFVRDFGILFIEVGLVDDNPGDWTQKAAAVPEPASLALFIFALGGLGFMMRRRVG